MTTITISRHYGSGGRKVGARVRELLDYRFFDKQLMTQVASELNLSQAELLDFSEVDYKVKGFFERLMSFNPGEMVVSPKAAQGLALESNPLDDTNTVRLVQKTILAAYEGGNVVIVGRGSQVILRGKPDVLHVRVIAPMETRLQRLQEVEGLSLQEARQRIKEHDKAGQDYLARFFDAQWDDPYLYHITINTGLYDIEQAAQLVVSSAHQLFDAVAAH